MLDERGALADADEPGASLLVDDALLGLKCARPSELQLEHLGAGDRVHSKRVHAGDVRQDAGSSFTKARGVRGRSFLDVADGNVDEAGYPCHQHKHDASG